MKTTYDHDLEAVNKAVKILGKTDRCCFCEYKCPTPTEQEERDRESGFGVLDSLWDHIEQVHMNGFHKALTNPMPTH